MNRSPLIWFGGKGKLAPDIIRHMPLHYTYVEWMVGGCNVIGQKVPSTVEIVNDIDEDLINFLLVNRENPERLAKALVGLPYSRALYDRWKWGEKPTDPFERAVRWFYLNRSAVAAGNNHRSGWRHGKSATPAKDFRSAIGKLADFAERFKGAQIECRHYREMRPTYDSPKTLHYIDPPYVGRERRYKGGFRKADHVELAKIAHDMEGNVMMSYYPDPLIDQLYFYPGSKWRKVEFQTYTTSQVSKGEDRPERTELLLMNWKDDQITIFDAFEATGS